jgi:hypothetical protein
MSGKSAGAGRPAEDWRQQATMSLTRYAEVVGVGRNTAYDAARAGEIPIIKLRGRKLVPVAWVLRQLEGRAA